MTGEVCAAVGGGVYSKEMGAGSELFVHSHIWLFSLTMLMFGSQSQSYFSLFTLHLYMSCMSTNVHLSNTSGTHINIVRVILQCVRPMGDLL